MTLITDNIQIDNVIYDLLNTLYHRYVSLTIDTIIFLYSRSQRSEHSRQQAAPCSNRTMPAISISHFFILSPRGDSIINQNCEIVVCCPMSIDLMSLAVRHDTAVNAPEVFFRKAKFWKGDAPPIFVSHITPEGSLIVLCAQLNDGLTYVNLKRNGLWFVCVTNKNVSPVCAMCRISVHRASRPDQLAAVSTAIRGRAAESAVLGHKGLLRCVERGGDPQKLYSNH